jgi:hypothetical protein
VQKNTATVENKNKQLALSMKQNSTCSRNKYHFSADKFIYRMLQLIDFSMNLDAVRGARCQQQSKSLLFLNLIGIICSIERATLENIHQNVIESIESFTNE